jgi:hypothetical protein
MPRQMTHLLYLTSASPNKKDKLVYLQKKYEQIQNLLRGSLWGKIMGS